MEDITLDLSSRQMSRLRNGHTIQVKPDVVGRGMPLKLHGSKVRKLHTAARRQKGCRLDMSPEEFEASGISWKGFKRGVSKAAKETGKVLKVGYKGYQEYLKPTLGPAIRKGLQTGARALGAAAAAATAQPELALVGELLARETIPYIGDKTGAFGMKEDAMKLLKSGFKGYKKHVKPTVGPMIRRNLQKGARAIAKAAAEASGRKELLAVGDLIADKTIPYIGSKTGAFGMSRKKRFNTSMVDTGLPADRPLVDIGNLQYGQDFIRGVGYGVMVAGSLYP